jgi:hypothetical protein
MPHFEAPRATPIDSNVSSPSIHLSEAGKKVMQAAGVFYEGRRVAVADLDEGEASFKSPHISAVDGAELVSRIVIRTIDQNASL